MSLKQNLTPEILDDLARSGLTESDAKRMKITAYEQQMRGDGARLTGYTIPYFNIDTSRSGFFRVRLIPAVLDRKGKLLRYIQPPDSAPELYFPPLLDWKQILADKEIPIMVTEGEKKSYAACRHLPGFPCIGLGGIYSYGSKSLNEPVLPELAQFFMGRKFIVCYDQDAEPNPDVTRAYNRLARHARVGGAVVYRLNLPRGKLNSKMGLDDAIVELGADEVLHLLEDKLEPYEDQRPLEDLNKVVAFIAKGSNIYHLPDESLHSMPTQLVQVTYASRKIRKFDAKGEMVEKNALTEWLAWPGRREHSQLVYAPGQSVVTPRNEYNIWKGLAVEPQRGDVKPFLKLLDQLFADDLDGKARKWFMQWLAYPLKHPGTKLYSAVLMYSEKGGVGKSLLGDTMGRIYGDNYVLIEAEDLHDSFNEWAKGKQFIHGDEVTGRDRREDANRFKNLVTKEMVRINEKYQAKYQVAHLANYYLTTNYANALSLDNEDRRWFIWEIFRNIHDRSWYSKVYRPWFRDQRNAAAILYYLLNDVKPNGFDPYGFAPITNSKKNMQSVSGNSYDFRVKEFLAAIPAGTTRDLYTAAEVAHLLDPLGSWKLDPGQTAVALKRNGALRLDPTNVSRGTIALYAIRNFDRWRGAQHAERVANYDGDSTPIRADEMAKSTSGSVKKSGKKKR